VGIGAGGPLNAFNYTGATGLTVTIDTGEGFVGGAWVAQDVTDNVTLAASTANQKVYLGWDSSETNDVEIGLSSAFASDDPKIEIWEFDTDASSVTSNTDLRQLSRPIPTHASQHESTGTDTLDAGDLGGSSGNSGDILTSDGTDAGWSAESSIDAGDLGGSSGSNNEILVTNGTNANWGHYNAYSTNPNADWTQHSLTSIDADTDLVNIGSGSGWFIGGVAEGRGLINATYTVDGNTNEVISDDVWETSVGINVGVVYLPPVRYETSLVIAINIDEGESDDSMAQGVTIQE